MYNKYMDKLTKLYGAFGGTKLTFNQLAQDAQSAGVKNFTGSADQLKQAYDFKINAVTKDPTNAAWWAGGGDQGLAKGFIAGDYSGIEDYKGNDNPFTNPNIRYDASGRAVDEKGQIINVQTNNNIPIGQVIGNINNPTNNPNFDASSQTIQPITSSGGKSPYDLVSTIQNNINQTTTTPVFNLPQGTLLKEGTFNNDSVKQLQGLLGIIADGDFGPQTKASVITFQKANGLTPDGIVGPQTMAALNAKFGQQTQQPIYDNKTGFLTPYGQSLGAKPVQTNDPSKQVGATIGTTTSGVTNSASARINLEKARVEAERVFGKIPKAPTFTAPEDLTKLAGAKADRETLAREQESLLAERLALDAEFQQFASQQGKGVTEAGRIGAISEERRNYDYRKAQLDRQELVLETKLANRNTTIKEIMGNQQTDFANATAQYDKAFNQALKMYDIMDDEADEIKANAKANLDVLGSMYSSQIEAGKLSPLSITLAQKRELEKLELQAGLPIGSTLAIIQTLKPGEEEIYKSFDKNTGNLYITTKNASGKVTTKIIKAGAPDASDAETNTITQRLEGNKGSDGYVDPYYYRQLRQNSKISPSQFDARYRHYVNPASHSLVGFSDDETLF